MKLYEVVVQANDQMTAVQQTALLAVYIALSNSPEAGAQALKGDEKKMSAGEFLLYRQFVAVAPSGIVITQRGVAELTSMGLIAQGLVTDKGKMLINPEKPAQPAPQSAAPTSPTTNTELPPVTPGIQS